MLSKEQDAFGHMILDYLKTGVGYEIAERDDGFFGVAGGPKAYFREYDEWPNYERQAMKFVRGRVLDIGCGAGRHAIYLQDKGHDVLGIDISPLAVEVSKRRGLKRTKAMSVTEVSKRLGIFDTILMLGNNFGLFGGPKRAKWLLRRFYNMTSAEGRIVAESNDPYRTELPEHLEYHEYNRRRGRLPGQLRIRVRYKKHVPHGSTTSSSPRRRWRRS